MGASRAASGSQPKAEKPAFSSFGIQAPSDSGASGYRLGAGGSTASNRPTLGYLDQSQRSDDAAQRPTSMVGEVRKAGTQIFNNALGINTEGVEDDAVKVPGISTSRMAGEVLKGFTDKLSAEIDPTKAAQEDIDPERYGIGAPTKPDARYTSSASSLG